MVVAVHIAHPAAPIAVHRRAGFILDPGITIT
jgi:hypothetical protein